MIVVMYYYSAFLPTTRTDESSHTRKSEYIANSNLYYLLLLYRPTRTLSTVTRDGKLQVLTTVRHGYTATV